MGNKPANRCGRTSLRFPPWWESSGKRWETEKGVSMTKWQQYEAEKKKLLLMDLTPEQYEQKVREITKKLNI